LRRLENRKVNIWQSNAVIGHQHYLQYLRIKPEHRFPVKKGFLEEIFLRLALIIFLFFFGLFYFFHEKTFAIAMQPWFVPVFAEVRGYIISVELKTRVNKQAGKVCRNQRGN